MAKKQIIRTGTPVMYKNKKGKVIHKYERDDQNVQNVKIQYEDNTTSVEVIDDVNLKKIEAQSPRIIIKTTYLEPRKVRRATTGLNNGGFYIVEKTPSYSKRKIYFLGFCRHANAQQHKLKHNQGTAKSEHVITKKLYSSLVIEAKVNFRKHKDVIEPGEKHTTIEKF